MYGRAREPERPETPRTRSAPQPAVFAGLGNQAMIRLLRPGLAREPAPSRLKADPVTDLPAGDYAETLRGGGSVIPLYVELAKLLDVTKLEGFSVEINRALRPDPANLKPGLNFVARFGDRGQTGYLVDGEFTGTLPTTRTGSEPKVAILLGPGAFDPGNKAAALGVLRHEMEHAFHDQLAAKALKRWREDTGAEKTPFGGWLEKQSMSAVDRALLRERIAPASKINTEALAHLEGFIAGFPVEAKDVKEGAHRVYENELKEAARHWVASDKAVQAEFITRLKALKARLAAERLDTLVADLKELKTGDKSYAPLVDAVLG
jgi:hypothetical protein